MDGDARIGLMSALPPRIAVNLAVPDRAVLLAGNGALPGVWSFAADAAGPHVVIVAVMHGNEIAGAVALERLLARRVRPARGRLSLVFANLDAFARFDPDDPTATRFLDEDMNRVWDPAVLDGPRRSAELGRARALRPLFDTADLLVDLHSMLWRSDPLILAGTAERGAALGLAIGTPPLVVRDTGHACGRRLIDYGRFSDPAERAAAVLVEAGDHWEPATVARMERSIARLLALAGMAPEHEALPPARLAEVTRTVTAATHAFGFVREFRGGEVIPERNTVIALDGEIEIRTPHDDCLLVMPTPMAPRGHTAVRLARFVAS